MKKIKILIFLMMTFLITDVVYATSVSINVSSSSITKGSSVTVTASIKADSGIYTTEGTLTCTGAGVSKSADLSYEDLNTANTSKSFSFTIKPTSSGTVTCKTSNVMIRELKEASRYSLNNASATITVKEPVVVTKPPKEYSSNNNLKSLEVEGYTLSEAFSKDIKEYSVEVPNGTEKVTVSATKEDSSASIIGTGEITVSEGINKIEVKVTAENGNINTYIINVTVKELEPIEVTVGNNKYTIIRKEGMIEAPTNYEKTSVKIGEEDVLCYKNEITGNILIGLKDVEGNAKYYSYNEEDNTYTLYNGYQIGNVNLNIIDMPSSKIPNGYQKVTFEYANNKIEGYQYIDSNVTYAADDKVEGSDFYLIYAVNELTGKEGLYIYDKLEGTVQRYNNSLSLMYEQKTNDYFLYLLISIVVIAVLFITLMVVLMKKKRNKHKFA